MNCALTCQLIRKGVTAEAYVSIRNRNPPLCKYVKPKNKLKTGPCYQDREMKIMMVNITMIISFPSVLMINSYSYQGEKAIKKKTISYQEKIT